MFFLNKHRSLLPKEVGSLLRTSKYLKACKRFVVSRKGKLTFHVHTYSKCFVQSHMRDNTQQQQSKYRNSNNIDTHLREPSSCCWLISVNQFSFILALRIQCRVRFVKAKTPQGLRTVIMIIVIFQKKTLEKFFESRDFWKHVSEWNGDVDLTLIQQIIVSGGFTDNKIW